MTARATGRARAGGTLENGMDCGVLVFAAVLGSAAGAVCYAGGGVAAGRNRHARGKVVRLPPAPGDVIDSRRLHGARLHALADRLAARRGMVLEQPDVPPPAQTRSVTKRGLALVK